VVMVTGIIAQAISFVMRFWYILLAVIAIIFVYNFTYDFFLPEYCVTDSSENRATITAQGFEISESTASNNQICFRSNNQQLVQSMFQDMHDKQLEEQFKLQRLKEENRNRFVMKLLEPIYFYPILFVLFILGLYYINSKKDRRY